MAASKASAIRGVDRSRLEREKELAVASPRRRAPPGTGRSRACPRPAHRARHVPPGVCPGRHPPDPRGGPRRPPGRETATSAGSCCMSRINSPCRRSPPRRDNRSRLAMGDAIQSCASDSALATNASRSAATAARSSAVVDASALVRTSSRAVRSRATRSRCQPCSAGSSTALATTCSARSSRVARSGPPVAGGVVAARPAGPVVPVRSPGPGSGRRVTSVGSSSMSGRGVTSVVSSSTSGSGCDERGFVVEVRSAGLLGHFLVGVEFQVRAAEPPVTSASTRRAPGKSAGISPGENPNCPSNESW